MKKTRYLNGRAAAAINPRLLSSPHPTIFIPSATAFSRLVAAPA
jgi:hypothetical protein